MSTTPAIAIEQTLAHLGQRLAQARILKSLTQEDLAAVCGVSRRLIQRMEDGQNVTVGTWMTAASHLGYLGDLVEVFQQEKPETMGQFQAIAQGKMKNRHRVRK